MALKSKGTDSPLFMGIIVFAIFAALLVRTWYNELNYTQKGIRVSAVVTRTEVVRTHRKKHQNTVYAYGEYTVDGRTYEARIKNVDSPHSGMKVDGCVLPDEEDVVYVPSGRDKMLLETVLFGILGCGSGIWMIYRGLGKGIGVKKRLLNERGITTNGYVVDCSCDYDSEPYRYYVTVRYTDEYGADHEFQIVGGKEYSEGEEVTVRYALKDHSEFIAEIVG